MSVLIVTTPAGLKIYDEMNQVLSIDIQTQPHRLLFSTPPLGVSIDYETVDYLLCFLHQWAHAAAQTMKKDEPNADHV